MTSTSSVRLGSGASAARRALCIALASAALCTSSCGGRSGNDTQDVYRRSKPARSPALEYLPRDTRFVLVASSMSRLFSALDRDALVERHRAPYERAVATLVQSFGADLLQPSGMLEAGLDPDGAWGVAWLPEDCLVVFAPVRAEDRLKKTIYRAASWFNNRASAEVVGKSLIIRPDDDYDWQVVIRDRTALLVIALREDVSGAQRVAELVATDSLARDPRFSSAMSSLGFGADIAGFAAGDVVLGRLADALGLGDAPLVFGIEIAPGALLAKAHLTLAKDALLGAVLRPGDRPPALLAALTREPLLHLAGHIDPAALGRAPWMRGVAREFMRLGVNLQHEVVPLVAGDAGVAVVPKSELRELDAAALRDIESLLDLQIAVEITDPGAARSLLARVTRRWPEATEARHGEYVIPDGSTRYHVGIRGSYFYVSTDPGFADRLAATRAQPVARQRELAVLLEAPRGALRGSLDARVLGWLWTPIAIPHGDDIVVPSTEGSAKDSEAPYSDEYRRKEQELHAAREQARQASVELEEAEARRELAFFASLGISALRAELGGDALVVYGGQFFGPDRLGSVLDVVLRRVTGTDRPGEEAYELSRQAHERVRVIGAELGGIRERDVESYERSRREAEATAPGAGIGSGEPDLSKEDIQDAIRAKISRFKYCYDRALVTDPTLQGKVVVTFEIGRNGSVTSATASGMGPKVDECIARMVRGLQFPRPGGGGTIKVSYPFVFAQ